MTADKPVVGHPDETGPFVCELCDETHPGNDEAARAIGWGFSWDGWLCPAHTKELTP